MLISIRVRWHLYYCIVGLPNAPEELISWRKGVLTKACVTQCALSGPRAPGNRYKLEGATVSLLPCSGTKRQALSFFTQAPPQRLLLMCVPS